IWYPTSALERIPWVAERGFNTALLGGAERVKAAVDRYWESWHAHHGADEPRPKVGAVRELYVAESDTDAFATAQPHFRQHHENLVKLWREHNMRTAVETFTPHLDEEMRDQRAFIGSPSTVRDGLATFVERTGVDYVLVRPMFGDLRLEQ